MRPISRVLAAATAAVALTGLAACSSSAPTNSGGDSSTGNSSGSTTGSAQTTGFTCPSGGINFGIEPYEDASQLTPAYQELAKSLSTTLNCKINVQITESYASEILAMQAGKLQMGEFGPLGYVFASQNADAVPAASFALANGKLSTYTAGIWVKKSSDIKSVKDLNGKTLALSSQGSTSGDAYPRYALMQAGLSASDVKTNYAGGHPQSLLALVNGKVDAAEVNSQQEATAIAAKQFNPSDYREIFKSAPIPNDPIALWGKNPAGFNTAVTKALLNVPASDLKKIGDYLDFNPAGKMKAVTKSDYQQLFDLANTLHLTTKDLS